MIDKMRTGGSLSEKADAAFQQAAVKVVERARQTGTPVILWEDNHVKEVPPDQIPENRTPQNEDGQPCTN